MCVVPLGMTAMERFFAERVLASAELGSDCFPQPIKQSRVAMARVGTVEEVFMVGCVDTAGLCRGLSAAGQAEHSHPAFLSPRDLDQPDTSRMLAYRVVSPVRIKPVAE